MAEIFVSYKSEDRRQAEMVAEALRAEGLDVWWDPALQAGEDYQEVIDRNLREALVVVVLWSPLSVKSRWVRSEATVGDRYGALAPAMITSCDLPTAFVLVQTADLTQWPGDRNDPRWQEFAKDVIGKRDQRKAAKASNTAPAAPDSGQIESLFWETVRSSRDPADYRSYLKRYPSGHFTDLARSKLVGLTGAWRGWAFGGAAAAIAAAAIGGYVLFGPGLPGGWPSAEEATATSAAVATDPVALAHSLVGRWAPEGLTCSDAVTITVAEGRLSLAYAGAQPGFETISGRETDGSIRTSANGASFFYSVAGDTLTLRNADGATATFDKCAG